jgi:hypothetical protein
MDDTPSAPPASRSMSASQIASAATARSSSSMIIGAPRVTVAPTTAGGAAMACANQARAISTIICVVALDVFGLISRMWLMDVS